MNLRTFLLCLLCLVAHAASAATCSKPSGNVRHARNELRHAASEAELLSAKRYARLAERALDSAAKHAAGCACAKAQQKFRRAALYARHAKIAKDQPQFSIEMKRSLREFDAANRAWRQCGGNR